MTPVEESLDTMECHVDAILELQERGAVAFEYGNNLRGQVEDHRGREDVDSGHAPLSGSDPEDRQPFDFPGFVPAYIGRFSVAAADRFAGRRCRVILRTSTVWMREVTKLFPRKRLAHSLD